MKLKLIQLYPTIIQDIKMELMKTVRINDSTRYLFNQLDIIDIIKNIDFILREKIE